MSAPSITIRGARIDVTIARREREQAQGLSGRLTLPANRGMLFVYAKKTTPNFWMKQMFFPLDIVWIADGRIVDLTREVPTQPIGTPENMLPLYASKAPVDLVLEVAAGTVERFGWAVGDVVQMKL